MNTTDTVARLDDMVIIAMINESANVRKAYWKFLASPRVLGMSSDEFLTNRNRHLNRIKCYEENVKPKFKESSLN